MNSQNPVGYGQPPKEHQFKKGKSGNPKGRPKSVGKPGAPKLNLALADELDDTLTVTENGKKKHITKLEGIVKATVAKAIKGDIKAIALLLKMVPAAQADATRMWDDMVHAQVMEAVHVARKIIAERRKKHDDVQEPATSTNWEAFSKAQEEAEKKGEILLFDVWEASIATPPSKTEDGEQPA
jgi:hypothetical protein